MKFIDIDFSQLLAILEENDYCFEGADDYRLLSFDEEAGVATFKLICHHYEQVFKLRRMGDVFVVTGC